MAEEKYNRKNPAVKRILQEVKEMQENPSDDFMSLPLEENIFEWQFAIRGPPDTEFEGGIYHGRIQLPAEYPFKPPAFMLLTPNGRFETQTKICLSISNYHPEHWQPSWSVRTALMALITFMPTSPNGALGSLDYPKEERRGLAAKSREAAPKFGTPERQRVIDEIHEYMLSKVHSVPQLKSPEPTGSPTVDGEENSQERLQNGSASDGEEPQDQVVANYTEVPEVPLNPNSNPNPILTSTTSEAPARDLSNQSLQRSQTREQKPADDRLFTWAAIGLTIAIVVLLLKKFIKSSGYGAPLFMDGS
ncbi:PREDICTED: ubiquitin-conjugating enzyme E2 32-like [Tarenaya hassleriana]|uniref:ubiquitin-conjugating enzyme E2 32-like n=1 Tax=Tarenaya hassleriana TaxID=28532 RepID=UPI00053C44D8|nr:PREDICTED: ubiquitin-conjugating enzyme E2 32-like [Tarenaya hassleriana]